MNTFVRLLPAMLACVVTQAFGFDPPPGSDKPAKVAAPVTAPVTGPQPAASSADAKLDASQTRETSSASRPTEVKAATATPKQTRIVLEDKTLTNDEIRQLFAAGYKPVGRDGQVAYCRREEDIGSHFKTMHCKTAEQMKQLARDSQDMAATAQRPNGCGNGGC